jgi:hypothetical protein
MNLTDIARQTLLGHTVAHLRDLAREAGIEGRSKLRKAALAEALIPTQLAEMAQVGANRARQAALTKQTERVAPLASSPVGLAMEAKDRYLEVVGRLGAENGGPAVSIAWEDYLDACYAAETCTVTICWDRATDGDGRCGRHSHGAPLGQDVVPTSEPEPVSRETVPSEPEQAAPISRGYTDCECRDCFDVTIGGSCCSLCEEAGCSDDGDQECYRDDAYQG